MRLEIRIGIAYLGGLSKRDEQAQKALVSDKNRILWALPRVRAQEPIAPPRTRAPLGPVGARAISAFLAAVAVFQVSDCEVVLDCRVRAGSFSIFQLFDRHAIHSLLVQRPSNRV